jgi:hypothetical protein
MRKFAMRLAGLGLVAAAGIAPGVALADPPQPGIYYFNDGNGTCGYISCGENGCTVIDTFPCPREVSPD